MLRHILYGSGLALSMIPHAAFAQEADWSGPYVGVTAGIVDTTTVNVDNWCWGACSGPTIQAINPSIGGTIGFNKQVDSSLVVGLEADFSTAGNKTVITASSGYGTPLPQHSWTADYDWTSSVRGRVGLTTGKSMVYVTGGYSIAKATFNQNTSDYGPFATNPGPFGANWSGTLKGYSFGAGVEHSFGRLSAKAEVVHSKYGVMTACYADAVGPTAGQCITAYSPEPPTLSFVPSTTTVRFGVNYRF